MADMVDLPVYHIQPPLLHHLIPEQLQQSCLVLLPGVSGHEGRGEDPASDLLSQPLEGESVEVEVAEMRQGLELHGEGGVVEEIGEVQGAHGRHLEGEVAAVNWNLKDRRDEDWGKSLSLAWH